MTMQSIAAGAPVDASLEEGRQNIEWARQHMPICSAIAERFEAEEPLEGETIAMAMHVEATTAVLVETLAAGGATVAVTGCNPLSTHDDVSLALDAHDRITSYARHGVDHEAYYEAMDAVLEHEPTITVDDGADLIFKLHESFEEIRSNVKGGCEETTTGVHRLRSMAADDALTYPVYAVNDTPMKRLFDNVHGTGESSLANIAISTNQVIAGSTVVVAGYGFCGRGIAKKAAGQNADVIVTEVDPRRALEAHMEGYRVLPMAKAATIGDIFITATGNRDVITVEHCKAMQDGALLANGGHFNVEVDLEGLEAEAESVTPIREGIEEYRLADGTRINVLAEGRLVNLASPHAQGHPMEVMDQSFGVQAACVEAIADSGQTLEDGVHDVPDEIDREIAEIKLAAEGIDIDTLSAEQREYLSSWEHGT